MCKNFLKCQYWNESISMTFPWLSCYGNLTWIPFSTFPNININKNTSLLFKKWKKSYCISFLTKNLNIIPPSLVLRKHDHSITLHPLPTFTTKLPFSEFLQYRVRTWNLNTDFEPVFFGTSLRYKPNFSCLACLQPCNSLHSEFSHWGPSSQKVQNCGIVSYTRQKRAPNKNQT